MDNKINDALLLVGEVSEVRGAKVKVRVYSEANEAHIFYRGSMLRGVSVGGFIKIPCGFDTIIGSIEGDYQQERRANTNNYEANREAPGAYLDRYVDVSVFGVFCQGRFDRGVTVLPLVRSKAYILTPDELSAITSLTVDDKNNFRLGSLSGHDSAPVNISASKLFASHVGVFGNTGSGKSNTLCRLYTDYLERVQLDDESTNRFVFIDFNGEYTGEKVLTTDKIIYSLDTRDPKDRIPVPNDFYFDGDIWAMLSQATERTQRPLLKRCIATASRILTANDAPKYIRVMVDNLFKEYAAKPIKFIEQKDDIFLLLITILKDDNPAIDIEKQVSDALDPIGIWTKSTPPKLCRVESASHYDFLDTADQASTFFKPIFDLPMDFDALSKDLVKLLKFAAWFVFIERCRDGSSAREHVAPWLNRYLNQLDESKKIYEYDPNANHPWPSVVVVSLLDVNQEQKKIIPLVVAKTLYQKQKVRGRIEQSTSTHLIIDEAHNILSYSSQRESEDWRDYRLETFEEIIKEGRKFGMYLTVCSQRPADISPTIISQMHNYFIHRLVNEEDLRAIGKAVSFIDAANASMIPILSQGCCIVSGTATTYPIRVQIDVLEQDRQPLSADRDLSSNWKT